MHLGRIFKGMFTWNNQWKHTSSAYMIPMESRRTVQKAVYLSIWKSEIEREGETQIFLPSACWLTPQKLATRSKKKPEPGTWAHGPKHLDHFHWSSRSAVGNWIRSRAEGPRSSSHRGCWPCRWWFYTLSTTPNPLWGLDYGLFHFQILKWTEYRIKSIIKTSS